MNKQPLLSVCIPTYNRAPFLRECLNSIAPQIKRSCLENKINIVIADNASTDETEKVVSEFISLYPELITYFKNETNLGFDRSFTRLIESSQGKFCFCLGDDDALFDNCLATLIEILEKNPNVGLVWINNWGYDGKLEKPLLPHPNLIDSGVKHYPKLSDYISAYQPSENLVGVFVGLSNQLLRRSDWVSFPDKEKYFDTQAVHMFISLQVFKTSPFLLITKPMVKTRASNIRWEVFAGLETIYDRIASTIKTAIWIRDLYNLPISNFQIHFKIKRREYWSTTKETIKGVLKRAGLRVIIEGYRAVRNKTLKKAL